jgi:hypothetical protein
VIPDSNKIHISALSRGIVDYFFCFTCDGYVWHCDHLIDEPLDAPLKIHSHAVNGVALKGLGSPQPR